MGLDIFGKISEDNMTIFILLVLSGFVCFLFTRHYYKNQLEKVAQILERFLQGEIDGTDDLAEGINSRISFLINQIQSNILDTMVKEKIDGERLKGLISDISHQFRTPLANIRMYGELMEGSGHLSLEQKDFLKKIKSATIQSEWLLKNLINASRLEEGIINFKADGGSLRETIAEAVMEVYHLAEKRNIIIVVEPFQDVKVFQNFQWTKEVFINILENAIKYSCDNTKVLISVKRQVSYMAVYIKDNGMGIPKKDLNKIFGRFYRCENVKDKQGSGLGLYLVQLILLKEGGNVTVESDVGKGSVFTVFLKIMSD